MNNKRKMTIDDAIKNVTAYVYMECLNMPTQVITALDVLKDCARDIEQLEKKEENIEKIELTKEGISSFCKDFETKNEEKLAVKFSAKNKEITISIDINNVDNLYEMLRSFLNK